MSDEEKLISRCQQGELEKFGLLYDKYIKKIYDFVYYKTMHKETAEDLVSQIFMKALSKIMDFKFNQGTFQAWLYRIARNSVIDHYRTKKQDINIEDVWDLAGDADLERDIDNREKLKAVEKYLAKLKPSQREIIVLRVWQELSYKEIADITGKSEDSCKMAYSRAINRLRREVPIAIYILLLLHL